MNDADRVCQFPLPITVEPLYNVTGSYLPIWTHLYNLCLTLYNQVLNPIGRKGAFSFPVLEMNEDGLCTHLLFRGGKFILLTFCLVIDC